MADKAEAIISKVKAIKPMTEEEASVPLTSQQEKDMGEVAKLLSKDDGETGGSETGTGRLSPVQIDNMKHGLHKSATYAQPVKKDDEGKGKGGGFLEFFGLAGGRRRRRRKKSRKKKKSKKRKSRRRSRRRRGGECPSDKPNAVVGDDNIMKCMSNEELNELNKQLSLIHI